MRFHPKNSKFLVIPIATSLLLGSLPAHAAVKAGSTCAKKGAIQIAGNKKFTCVTKGKKLVWNAGVATSSPKTTTTPSASPSPVSTAPKFEPWATKFDYKVMVNAALAKTAEYFGSIKPDDSYKVIVDPLFKSEDLVNVKKVLSYVNGMFSNVDKKERTVFIGTTHKWGAETLKLNNLWVGDPRSAYPCSDGSRDAMCAEGNLILMIYSDIYGSTNNYGWDYGRVSVPAHEYFHTIQATLSSETGIGNANIQPTKLTLPVWLDEGSANFLGFFTTNSMKSVDYFHARNMQVTNNPNYNKIYPLSEYIGRGNAADGTYLDPYGIGQAATEYLIASVGFKAIIDIYKNYKVSKDFPKAFKEAVGIEIDDFYAKFEAARSSLNI